METDHSKWREEIITGWKADQDEDVNIDDSDDDEGKVVTDKLQQPELPRASILLGGKKEVNLPWKNKRTPPPFHTSNIDLTHLRLAWVKVNDEGLRWPAKIVAETEVPPEILKPFLPVHGKIVHLFHSEKNLQPYQVVKWSCIYPFEQYYNLWKNLKDAPEFTAAVSEAYNLFCHTTQSSTTVKESLSTPRKNAVTIDEEDAIARMEDKVPPRVTTPRNNNEVEAEAHDSTHTHRSSINEASTETESPETVIELQVVVGKKQMRKSTVCLQGRNHVREKKTTCVNDAAAAQYVHERLSLDVEILVQEKGGQSSKTDGEAAAAARELAMGSSEEESMDWMAEYNHLCQQRCTFGGVLLNEASGSMEPADQDEQNNSSNNNGSNNAAAEEEASLSQITNVIMSTTQFLKQQEEIEPHDNPIPVAQVTRSPRIMHIGIAEEGQLGDVVAKRRHNMCTISGIRDPVIIVPTSAKCQNEGY